jgi:hypothetical protein
MFAAVILQKMASPGLTIGEHYINLKDCANLLKVLQRNAHKKIANDFKIIRLMLIGKVGISGIYKRIRKNESYRISNTKETENYTTQEKVFIVGYRPDSFENAR